MYLVLCFYFLLKRSSVLQFTNLSSFWTNLKLTPIRIIVRFNTTLLFIFAWRQSKWRQTHSQFLWGHKTSICVSLWPPQANWCLTWAVLKNIQPFRNAFPMLCHLRKKVRKRVRSGEAVRKGSDWGEKKKDNSWEAFTVDFWFSLQCSLTVLE